MVFQASTVDATVSFCIISWVKSVENYLWGDNVSDWFSILINGNAVIYWILEEQHGLEQFLVDLTFLQISRATELKSQI